MTVITRFPPSPTGSLHIGSARTALFNWLYARHMGGQFLLRIEDTDRERSTPEAVETILDGMRWLELDWDGDETYQSRSLARHAEVAGQLLETGKAYYCYCTPDELAEMREAAKRDGRRVFYDRRWRDKDPSEAPAGVDPVVRIKMPLDGETILADQVQGDVRLANEQLDDFILLRADGTPTYMLSVVVDDHDASVTHIIRGDDHLNNAFRQYHLYLAAGWTPPVFAHIPLIHGSGGQKLSKRHGATAVQEYREMGYLPAAMRNYLLRLGWSHGDVEIIDTEEATKLFDLDGIGRSAARFDVDKLNSVNAHYLRNMAIDDLLAMIKPNLAAACNCVVNEEAEARVMKALPHLTKRASTLPELIESAIFLVDPPTHPLGDKKAGKFLDPDGISVIGQAYSRVSVLEDWSEEKLNEALRALASDLELGFGKIAQPLRAALTGSAVSPGLFEVMAILGKDAALSRMTAVPGVKIDGEIGQTRR